MKHLLALTFLLSVVPLSQSPAVGGWDRNGVRLNGVAMGNGVRLNGVRLNGVRLNGPDLASGSVTLSDVHTVGGKLTR